MAIYFFRNTGDVNWGTASNWSLSDGGPADGAVPTVTDDARFTANSGNCTTNTSARTCLTLVCAGYANTLTLTNTLTVAGTITLSATMTISGAAQLICSVTATITSNTCVIPNLSIGTGTTMTATCGDVLNVTNLTVSGSNAAIFTINSNSINVSGNLTLGTAANTNTMTGTTTINLIGTGTWSQNVNASQFRNPININSPSGIISCGNFINYGGGTLTYITGTINASTTTLQTITACTLNVSGMAWGSFVASLSVTITLTSNFNCLGAFTFGNSTTSATVLNGFSIFVGGTLTTAVTTAALTGTTTIVMTGNGNIAMNSLTTGYLANNLTIDANGNTINLVGSLRYRTGTFRYISGRFISQLNSSLSIPAAATLIGMNKIFFYTVIITNGIVVTMNEFFSGRPETPSTIRSVTAGSTYTISFSDGFEKIAKFVEISDCVLSRPLQLVVIAHDFPNVRNTGIRYTNQSPNGFPKALPSVVNNMTYPTFSLTSDPTKH